MKNYIKLLFCGGWLLSIILLIFILCGNWNKQEYSQWYLQKQTPHIIENVVHEKLDSIQNLIVWEVDEFINENYPKSQLTPGTLVQYCLIHNFDIIFALAQGIQESGLGSAGLASRTNSVWNVGAYSGWSFEDIKRNGYIYPTQDHSIEPYILLVKNRYLRDKKTHEDLMKRYVVFGTNTRYAEDPNYEKSLRQMYDKINDQTNIGILQQQYYIVSSVFDIQ